MARIRETLYYDLESAREGLDEDYTHVIQHGMLAMVAVVAVVRPRTETTFPAPVQTTQTDESVTEVNTANWQLNEILRDWREHGYLEVKEGKPFLTPKIGRALERLGVILEDLEALHPISRVLANKDRVRSPLRR